MFVGIIYQSNQVVFLVYYLSERCNNYSSITLIVDVGILADLRDEWDPCVVISVVFYSTVIVPYQYITIVL